jgi:transcriptional regulator with XRE-family HTH domain
MTPQELRLHEERIQQLIYDQIDHHGYDAIRRSICRKRLKIGVTQAEVSQASGIEVVSIARWEAGQIRLSDWELVRIWKALFQVQEAHWGTEDSATIRSLRQELGLTQREVARLSSVTQVAVSRAESGSTISKAAIKRIVGTLYAEREKRSVEQPA